MKILLKSDEEFIIRKAVYILDLLDMPDSKAPIASAILDIIGNMYGYKGLMEVYKKTREEKDNGNRA